jgi:hypothetical protein
MNSIPRQLATFAAVLAGLYTAGFIAGQIIDPKAHGADAMGHREDTPAMNTQIHESPGHGAAADPVRGLAVAEDGLRIVTTSTEQTAGREQPLRFRITDAHGEPVRDFDVTHERRMHLIVARRDLTGFQHLHPTMSDDGTWSTPLRIDEPGSYRLFADFSHAGEATTLATDLHVDGFADLHPLPAPEAQAVSDGGYDVGLEPVTASPGEEAQLRFTITKDGAPIKPEPYLGAGGHLVALREGDLAFLHVHPTDHDAGDDGSVSFASTFPTEGRYRLFLQFQHAGRVHTVAFTQEVA